MWECQNGLARHKRPLPGEAMKQAQVDVVTGAPPPLSCSPSVFMQNRPTGLNWPENADNADETEINKAAYFLGFAN